MIKSISSLDPRSALIGAFLLSCWVACLSSLVAAAAALLLAACFLGIVRPPLKITGRRFLAANAFILFIWLVVPWTTPGHSVFGPVTLQGLTLSLLVTLKANAIFCIFMALIFPMPITILGNGLHRLGIPAKLVWLLLLMDRNIEILKREWRQLAASVKLRGFTPGNNLHTWKTYGAMLGLFLVKAYEQSERTREAMLLRGFTGKLPCVSNFGFSVLDIFFVILVLGCIAMLTGLEIAFPHV